MASLSLYILAVVAFTGAYLYLQPTRKKKNPPPGPKALPLLGNLLDFPPTGVPEYQHWLKHKDLYGPISSVTVMGMTLVLIHDQNIAHHLLEKTSSKTSGRPDNVFANDICGFRSIILCQGYTPTFRHSRKLLHQELGTVSSAAKFERQQEVEVNKQLVRVLREPDKWIAHFKTTSAATVLRMAYGYSIDTENPDPLVQLIDKVLEEFSLAAAPMAWMVDIIPFLRHLPEGFPGAGFQKTARAWRKRIQSSAYTPYRFVQRQMDSLTNRESYVSRLIKRYTSPDTGHLSPDDESAIMWTAASLYGAASDTESITFTAFTLAMLRYPDVQRKAQEEIDRVVGVGQLPTFEHRDKLPYVKALVKESLRWWAIAPMGFPHAADEDIDVDQPGLPNVRIPKGALLLPAVWWFLRDPKVYENPSSFDPERFLPPRNEREPTEAFGYGRRLCAGRFFAESSLYINIVQSLSVFDIKKAVDGDGNEIGVDDVGVKPGILSYPTEFQFRVVPRSEQHVEVVRRLEKELLVESGDAELLDIEE